MNEVTKHRGGLTALMAARFDMDPNMFLSVIKNTVMPSKSTNEEVAAFLMVAKEYNLNPLMREIYAFPKKGGGSSNRLLGLTAGQRSFAAMMTLMELILSMPMMIRESLYP